MPNYIINVNEDEKGYNEVHNETTCSHLPATYNRKTLGNFSNEIDAVSYAKRIGYTNADGCAHCCPLAHKG